MKLLFDELLRLGVLFKVVAFRDVRQPFPRFFRGAPVVILRDDRSVFVVLNADDKLRAAPAGRKRVVKVERETEPVETRGRERFARFEVEIDVFVVSRDL